LSPRIAAPMCASATIARGASRAPRAAPPAELAVSRVEALLAPAVSGARVPARGDGGVAVVAALGEQRGHDAGPTEEQFQAVVGAVVRNAAEGVLAA